MNIKKTFNIALNIANTFINITPAALNMYVNGENTKSLQYFKNKISNCGPLFIKAVQWLIQRPDLVSAEFIEEMKSLQNNCDYYNYEDMLPFIEKQNLSGLSIDKIPIGSGSLAQVHKGTFDNKSIIVKFIHPDTILYLESDLVLMKTFFTVVNTFSNILSIIDVNDLIEQLQQHTSILTEYDNLNKLKKCFNKTDIDHSVYIFPEIYFKCNEFIIETYIQGYSPADFLVKYGSELYCQAKVLNMVGFFKMAHGGVIHSDLHNGNILFIYDDINDKIKICFLDFGLVTILTDEEKTFIKSFCKSYINLILHNNMNKSSNEFITNIASLMPHVEVKTIKKFIIQTFLKLKLSQRCGLSIKSENKKKVIYEMIDFINQNNIKIRSNIIFTLLTSLIIENDVVTTLKVEYVQLVHNYLVENNLTYLLDN